MERFFRYTIIIIIMYIAQVLINESKEQRRVRGYSETRGIFRDKGVIPRQQGYSEITGLFRDKGVIPR